MKKLFCAIFCVAAALTLAACATAAAPEPVETNGAQGGETQSGTIQPEEISVEEYPVKKGDMTIYGTLYLPAAQTEKTPAVILSHSAALTSDSLQSYCIGFAERGYAAYAFDFCGGSGNSRSDGAEEDMTIFTELDDLKAVISAIGAREDIDHEKIYLFGTSQGGLVSALAANDCADLVAGLILLYPAFNIPLLAQQANALSGLFGSVNFGSLFGNFSSGFPMPNNGEAYIQTLLDYDAYEHIGAFQGEVLILHGSKDFIVSSSYSQRAAEIYEHCELDIIEGAGHGFNAENYSMTGDFDEIVWQFIDAYFTKQSV